MFLALRCVATVQLKLRQVQSTVQYCATCERPIRPTFEPQAAMSVATRIRFCALMKVCPCCLSDVPSTLRYEDFVAMAAKWLANVGLPQDGERGYYQGHEITYCPAGAAVGAGPLDT
jgi:hypothetical protein